MFRQPNQHIILFCIALFEQQHILPIVLTTYNNMSCNKSVNGSHSVLAVVLSSTKCCMTTTRRTVIVLVIGLLTLVSWRLLIQPNNYYTSIMNIARTTTKVSLSVDTTNHNLDFNDNIHHAYGYDEHQHVTSTRVTYPNAYKVGKQQMYMEPINCVHQSSLVLLCNLLFYKNVIPCTQYLMLFFFLL